MEKILADSERLVNVLKHLGITANALSLKLGYKSSNSLYAILYGKRDFGKAMMTDIIGIYPEINYNYLKYGQGPIANGEIKASKTADQTSQEFLIMSNKLTAIEFIMIQSLNEQKAQTEILKQILNQLKK